ncbi:MAG: hypothetical protein AAB817_02380, partial [Patescibacteria group bacterium]
IPSEQHLLCQAPKTPRVGIVESAQKKKKERTIKKNRLTEEKIIAILRLHAGGAKPTELCQQQANRFVQFRKKFNENEMSYFKNYLSCRVGYLNQSL